ncbi:MAG: SLC13 family permease [Phycisphaerales bacterium]
MGVAPDLSADGATVEDAAPEVPRRSAVGILPPMPVWVRTILGLVIALGVGLLCALPLGLERDQSIVAAVTALCAAWWCTEALPIPVTSLVPFVLFPLTGVLDHGQLASAYGDKFILLFMGGFMISRAAEKSRAHLRIADAVIRVVGTHSDKRIIIGFMLASAFCSMWISNTATALILLPVASAVIGKRRGHERFAVALLLAVAYGSSIGGITTLVGTAPNGVFASQYAEVTGKTVDFVSWMRVGVPICLCMLVACAGVLCFRIRGGGGIEREDLGPWTAYQVRVVLVLVATGLLWVTRTLPFGLGGWSVWLGMPKAHDATVALLAVVCMFLIPSGRRTSDDQPTRLLDWQTARDIPWGILLLFAGGLAIAQAFRATELADVIGRALTDVSGGMPTVVLMLLICLVVTFTTEVTSNTATTTLLMPILGAAGLASGVDPALFMIPAAVSASCAFMLPVATPPNAIVFGGSPHITIPRMASYGVVLNLIGAVVIALVCWAVVDPATGILATSTTPLQGVAP